MGRSADTEASTPASLTMNCTDFAPMGLHDAFRGATMQTIDARVDGRASVLLTRVRHAEHGFGVVEFMPPANSCLIGMSLSARPPCASSGLDDAPCRDARIAVRIWQDDEPFRADLHQPFDMLFHALPRRTLLELAAEMRMGGVRELACPDDSHDAVLQCLVGVLLSASAGTSPRSPLLAGHVARAMQIQIVQKYGVVAPNAPAKGGLAGWQLERAKAILTENVAGEVPISQVASACGLSRSYFIKAFRQTVGTTPHRWLLEHKIERVKRSLLSNSEPIADIANQCGFSDQAHLTRVFTSMIGTPPAAWRRVNRK
ncbi:Arabinose operon regulatory protein [Burkholderia oklahomensis]|nr:Arabinose operon regulatory protein [Burkholderia oklahomensis]